MSVSRSDLEILAVNINKAMKSDHDLIEAMCNAFASINPRFDKNRFLTKCFDGIEFPKHYSDVAAVRIGDRVKLFKNDKSAEASCVGQCGKVEDIDYDYERFNVWVVFDHDEDGRCVWHGDLELI